MIFIEYFIIILILFNMCSSEDYCDKDSCKPKFRYLLYDINDVEGFNLRRDVYMRFAIFVKKLEQSQNGKLNNFKLVLPPWSHLYHWTLQDRPQQFPWSYYFDLNSMKKFIPVIEMYEFFKELGFNYGKINIDEVFILQHYQEMFQSGKFEEKLEIDSCNENHDITFFYYNNITAKRINCLSFHGPTSLLEQLLIKLPAQSILIARGEVSLHDRYGDRTYWECRRSMRFNKDLKQIANEFRKKKLNSTDAEDNTRLPDHWWHEKQSNHSAKGGPYLSVHLRRRDFVRSRSKQIPSIKYAAKQINDKLKLFDLNMVFVATDASDGDFNELKKLLELEGVGTYKFIPSINIIDHYKDGGVAIIDQIICSHARYFIGTYESTFSFRIQEEREIIGFKSETSFNRFCGNDETDCNGKTTLWPIVY